MHMHCASGIGYIQNEDLLLVEVSLLVIICRDEDGCTQRMPHKSTRYDRSAVAFVIRCYCRIKCNLSVISTVI